ncbi:MAG: DUF2491 family protein [Syntrophobacteraceae bacterium]|jgi:hypothetical protein
MGIVSKILEKKGKQAISRVKGVFSGGPEKEPDYPLGLHLNATLRFDPTDFIIAEQSFKIDFPSGDISVVAIGEFVCLGVPFHRFYLKDLKNTEWVLEVADKKQDLEVALFQTVDEVYPDDWDFWLNDRTGLIGYKDFNTPDQVEYSRVFRNPGPDYLEPIEFEEPIRGGGQEFCVNHAMMLYSREISVTVGEKLTEYLLVSKEEDEEGLLVRIMAGIPVSPMSITIL